MRKCEHCGKQEFSKERGLKYCGRCKIVFYCSTKCQKADWPDHHRVCRPHKGRRKHIPSCGLCGNRKGPFIRTECCNRLVCDDEGSYRMMSYSRIHCHRNHMRYSLCAYHHSEKHRGRWQKCAKCKELHGEPYKYSVMAGNPPHLPFKFNFEEDAVKFDWSKISLPSCQICSKKIDTYLTEYVSCNCSGGAMCAKCGLSPKCPCTCMPKIHIKNCMDRF